MKILIVSRFLPYPEVTHSGGTNLFHYIDGLNDRGHDISLLSFIGKNELGFIDSIRPYCAQVNTVPAVSSLFRRIGKMHNLVRFPLQWVETYSPVMKEALQNIVDGQNFDIVHFEHLWTAQYFDLTKDSRVVLDEVDVDSLVYYRKYLRAKSRLLKGYYFWAWRRTIQLEAKMCKKANLVFTRSEKDRRYLQSIVPNQKIEVLPPWFEGISRSSLDQGPIETHSLLFVGNMGRILNIEAVEYFAQMIFPRVLKKIPTAKFYIAGDNPHDRVKRLAKGQIFVTGYVKNVFEYYARCQVFVAPILVGGGIIVKILDALAAGRPVVCTSIGNEGIEARPNIDLFVADTPNIFAQKIVELLTDPATWQRMAQHGRTFVENRFNWENIIDKMEQALLETAGI